MINKMVKELRCVLFLFFHKLKKKVADFNLDKINDTLTYNCDDKTNIDGQPHCMTNIITDKSKKKYMFNLSIYHIQ